MKSRMTAQQLAYVGLMTALVFVSSKIEIRIPDLLGVTRFHFGNGMCILAGLLMGAFPGGLAAGLGSFFFDLVFWGGSPVAWLVTFISKFAMGCVSGLLFHKRLFSKTGTTVNVIICGAAGELVYIVIYLFKNYVTYRWIMGSPPEAVGIMLVQKGLASLANAVIAIIIAVIFYRVMVPVLRKSGLKYDS